MQTRKREAVLTWLTSDKCVKYCDPRLNCSQEIPPEPIGGSIFDSFFRDNFRLEVVSDVISYMAIEYISMDVRLKFGDSRSNCSGDIRISHFVMGDDDKRWHRHHNAPVVGVWWVYKLATHLWPLEVSFLRIGIALVLFIHLLSTKSTPQISRKLFNLESLNFTGTPTPTLSTATLNMTSLSTSSWKL